MQPEDNQTKTITIGVIQSPAEPYAVGKNLKKLEKTLCELKSRKVKLALLPEFFPTGNTLETRLLKIAIEYSDTVQNWLAEQSRSLQMTIVGAYLNFDGKDVYNKLVIQEPDGSSHCHKKSHSPAPEAINYCVSKEDDCIVDTAIGKIGLIICIESFFKDIVMKDFRDCALVLIVFAIPNAFNMFPAVKKRLLQTPLDIAKRNGIPVALCSMGGTFLSKGSPVMPLKLKGLYIGRSGIYLPTGIIAGPLAPGTEGVLVSEIPLGPGVSPPDESISMDTGLPFYMRLNELFFKRKAEKLYKRNIDLQF